MHYYAVHNCIILVIVVHFKVSIIIYLLVIIGMHIWLMYRDESYSKII